MEIQKIKFIALKKEEGYSYFIPVTKSMKVKDPKNGLTFETVKKYMNIDLSHNGDIFKSDFYREVKKIEKSGVVTFTNCFASFVLNQKGDIKLVIVGGSFHIDTGVEEELPF